MGTTNTTQQQQTSVTPTAQQTQLLNNEMQVSNANVGNQISVNNNSANLINSILTGTYQGTANGITPGQNQSMVNQSLRDIAPQFQTSGILNSGEAGQIATQTAALTSNANAQFNVQTQQNLLNAGLGGSSSWSANNTGANQVTGNQLAGLNTINTSGVTTSNPFLNSFYSGAGAALGKLGGSVPTAALAAIPGGGAFSAAM